jgi:hypothetical protein
MSKVKKYLLVSHCTYEIFSLCLQYLVKIKLDHYQENNYVLNSYVKTVYAVQKE